MTTTASMTAFYLYTNTATPTDAMNTPTTDDDNVKPQDVAAAIILIVICIMGIIGNILVIVAVQLSRRLQTSTNVFVVTLSCTDVLTALMLPFQASSLLGTMDAHPALTVVCQVIGALSFVFNGWSIITLIAIAFNRYILITQTSQRYHRIFRKRNITLMLALIYSYPAFFVILFGTTGWADFGEKGNVCSVVEGKSFNVLSGVSMVTLMAAIFYFYLKIYLHVRNHVKRVQNKLELQMPLPSSIQQSLGQHKTEETNAKNEAMKKEHRRNTEVKVTQNMLLVVLCFFVCMLPITVTLFKVDLDSTVVVYSFVVLSLNSCLNPVIYAWKHPVFRQVFRCMLTCRLRDVEEPSRWLRERISNPGGSLKGMNSDMRDSKGVDSGGCRGSPLPGMRTCLH